MGGEKPHRLLQQHLTLAESFWDTPSWVFSTNEMSPIDDQSGKRAIHT